MSRIHAGRLIVFPVVAALLSPPAPGATPTREWRFTALLDNDVIGYQTFRLIDRGAEKVVVSEARYNVKFLFMNLYNYTHEDKEVWRDDCLSRIDSRTNDNGSRFFVRGEREQSRLALETVDGSEQLPGCVLTFAYWNPRILQAKRLLNAQTGEYLNVEITAQGDDTVTARGRKQRAQRYRIKTRKFTIDLWYSQQQEWLALETTTESGRRLRYRRD